MKDKVLSHIGSLLGGIIHNLNTPLMWVMGRSQLLQARNENLERLKNLPDEEIIKIREKNSKDIESIAQGADKIDHILKAISYKVQMANEGVTAIEIKEYLTNEMDFLLADMRFKHETKVECMIEQAKTHYVRVDYNALSWAFTGTINAILNATERGRSLKISLDNGIISIACKEMALASEDRLAIEEACSGLKDAAVIHMNDTNGFEVSIGIKGG
jgi:signal transduction histidine kinase